MVQSKYMTGEEFEKRAKARYLKFHPIAVWRAKRLAEEMDKVMKVYPEIQSILIRDGKVFCFDSDKRENCNKALVVFRMWVVTAEPEIIENVINSYGFNCYCDDFYPDFMQPRPTELYYFIKRINGD